MEVKEFRTDFRARPVEHHSQFSTTTAVSLCQLFSVSLSVSPVQFVCQSVSVSASAYLYKTCLPACLFLSQSVSARLFVSLFVFLSQFRAY